MAARRPVIATTVGGVVDLLGNVREVHDGFAVHERGVGVEPGNAASFVKGLIYLVKNERLRVDVSNLAFEFVQAHYAKERLIEDIRKLYRDLHR